MANKIIKVPVKDVDGLNKDGGYSLRYRIVSKDGNRKSQWSEIVNINYTNANNDGTQVSGKSLSFYERLNSANSAPSLTYYNTASSADPDNYKDPHDLDLPYDIKQVIHNLNPDFLLENGYINSGISISKDTEGVLEYTWDSLEKHADFLQQKFDVYLSFRTETDGWQDWIFAGTTTGNTFSFVAPTGRMQYVQAALFISSYPKLDNIYGQETNFVSISPYFCIYRDVGPVTVTAGSAPATGGKYTATITLLDENFPLYGWANRKVYADSTATLGGRNAFPEDTVVRARGGTTSFIVEASTAISSGTVYEISLVS